MDREIIKNYTTAAAVTVRRLVRFDATAPFPLVQMTTAATDAAIGVSTMSGDNGTSTIASGPRCDVILGGVTQVEAGAAFAAGAVLMSDATGRAITAAAAVGSNVRVVGLALAPATAAGDIVDIYLQQSTFQG